MINFRPYISEKSVALTKEGKFTILVDGNAKREEIIYTIKNVFNLKPKSIKIINRKCITEKKLRGKSKNRCFKKAIIELSKNEVMPGFETFSEKKEDGKKSKKNNK